MLFPNSYLQFLKLRVTYLNLLKKILLPCLRPFDIKKKHTINLMRPEDEMSVDKSKALYFSNKQLTIFYEHFDACQAK